MRPTTDDVEALAKRLHHLAMKWNFDNGEATSPWQKISENGKVRYRFVATDLLQNPPPPLAAPADMILQET